MSLTVQLDLFNNVVPIATFDWADMRDLKLFDYNTDMQFDDVQLEGNYIINVPCYKVDSLVGIVDKNANATWDKIAKNKDLHDCIVRIYETKGRRWGGKNTYYILANSKTKKFIEQQFLFAKLKDDIRKKPRIVNKWLKVESIHFDRDDLDCNFVMAKVIDFLPREAVNQIS
jgi:hypothetical protein